MENLQEHRQEEHEFLRRDRCYLKMPCSRSALFTLNSKPGADLNSQGQKCLSSIVLSLRLIKHFDGFWGFYKLCSCFSRVQVDKCWCTHSAATAGEPPAPCPMPQPDPTGDPATLRACLKLWTELKDALLTAYSVEISLPRALPRMYSKESLHKDLCQ